VLYGRTGGTGLQRELPTGRDIIANTNVGVGVQTAKEIMHGVASYSRFCVTLPCKAEKKWTGTCSPQKKGGKCGVPPFSA
jgi:hypothetical protein